MPRNSERKKRVRRQEDKQAFTKKSWFFLYLISALALIPLWKLLKMNPIAVLAYGAYLAILLPVHVTKYLEKKKQHMRLQDVSQYMDAMLYAFQKEGKIPNALEDVYHSLGDGNMRKLVEAAKNYVELTFDEVDVMAKGLDMIYESYPSRRIKNMHAFMLHVEYTGGEVATPVELLLQEKEMWELRMKQILAERAKMFRDVVLSIATSVGICAVVLYLPGLEMDLSQNLVSQILAVFLLCSDEVIFLRAQSYLAVDWVEMEQNMQDEYYAKKISEWKNWDESKESKLSFLLGGIVFVASAFAFAWKLFWLGCLGIALGILCINQHKLGHALAGRTVKREVVRAFPVWLMDLVLLLQSENVQNALVRSLEGAPGVLKAEIDDLVNKMEMDPENARPYHEFLEDFDVPEIHSAMNLLYAMSMGQGGSVEKQIGNLIRRNQEMQNMAERQQDENRTSGLYLLFLAPVLTGSFKLLVDMGLFMLAFLSSTL